jgi:hypothetical protein
VKPITQPRCWPGFFSGALLLRACVGRAINKSYDATLPGYRAFVDHVALMGLENTGFALANQALLWIDPLDYQADLACGVDMLRAAGVNVSIFNLPLCLLDRSLWDVAVPSISD